MAEGRNIEIKIAATGGDQAAAEVQKVETSTVALTAAQEDYQKRKEEFEAKVSEVNKNGAPFPGADSGGGFGGMLDGVPERVEEVTQSTETLTQSTQDLSDGIEEIRGELGPVNQQIEDIGQSSEESGAKLDKLVNLARAQVANQLSQGLGQIGREIQDASQKFAESDPEFSNTLGNLASGIDSASGALAGAAQGFAVGGPFGAAIGSLAGATLPQAKRAFDDMVESIIGANEAEARSVQLKQDLTAAQENFAAAVLTDEIVEQYNRDSEALQGLIDKLDQTKRVVSAEDKLASAKRDNEDAAAIRAGANPEDVRAKRAVDDANQAKARVDYELGLEKTLAIEKQNLAEKLQADLKKLEEDSGATPEQITQAQELVNKAKIDAAEQAQKFQNQSEIAPLERQTIDTRTEGKVSGLTSQRDERLKREQEAEDRRQEAEDRRTLAKVTSEQNRERQDQSAAARAAAGAGRAAEKLLPDNAPAAARKQLEKIADGLQDGDQGGEMKKLLDFIDLLTAFVERQGAGKSNKDEALRRIEIIEQRLRNLPQ